MHFRDVLLYRDLHWNFADEYDHSLTLYQMILLHSFGPSSLKKNFSMEYNHYPDLPNGANHHHQVHRHPPPPLHPYHYGGYYHPGGKVVFHPVIPHDNDILMGRGGKNNQHCGNEKLRQVCTFWYRVKTNQRLVLHAKCSLPSSSSHLLVLR